MKVGFTGRSEGVTDDQRSGLLKVLNLLKKYEGEDLEIFHNDGRGADQLLVELCRDLDIVVRATDVETPMKRNRSLVSQVEKVIAVPPTKFFIKKGSGTWATVRYAWNAGLTVVIVMPQGKTAITKNRYHLERWIERATPLGDDIPR